MRPGRPATPDKAERAGQYIDQIERPKASIQANLEHPFPVIQRQFGHLKVHYRGLKKSTAQLNTLFALAKL